VTSDRSARTTDQLVERLQAALGDAYAIERELGGGGMSRVFVARDMALDRAVVIKALREDVAEGISRERFRREVMVSATLQHPHIVGIIAAGDAAGIPYFVMPFVDGESLRGRIGRLGPLSVPEAVGIMRDIARALSFAHARGIVHRDIKPDNVLLAGGAASVADFGVAKALASARTDERHPHGTLTGAGISLGTPAYMAPEQVAGDPSTDHRADIYAFGMTAYEILTGTPPFARRAVADQLSAQLVETPPSLSAMRPGIPQALDALIESCVAKNPADRPQSADEILRLLEDPAMVSGEVSSSASPSIVRRSSARRRWRVGAVAAAAVVVATVGTALALRGREETAQPLVGVTTRPTASGVLQIAVFPLVSLSADSADAFVADGVTEALANAFAAIPGARVASPSAAVSGLRAGQAPTAVATALGVSVYLEGTFQRNGSRVRVTVRLVNAADGFMLWSDVYERDKVDVLTAQTEIARDVAAAVREGLGA
jgi:serine/threonine-protein kinase